MRKITMEQLEDIMESKGSKVNSAILRLRQEGREQTNKRRPRSEGEIRALNKLARESFLNAEAQGDIIYDRERRVLIFNEFLDKN